MEGARAPWGDGDHLRPGERVRETEATRCRQIWFHLAPFSALTLSVPPAPLHFTLLTSALITPITRPASGQHPLIITQDAEIGRSGADLVLFVM